MFDILSLNKSILFRNRICGGKRVVMVSKEDTTRQVTIEVLVKNLLLQIAWKGLGTHQADSEGGGRDRTQRKVMLGGAYCLVVLEEGHVVATEGAHKQNSTDIVKALDPLPSL